MVYSRVHRSFLLFSCIFREWGIQENCRKRIFSSVHRSVNARKLSCVPTFAEVFLHFLWQQMRVNARKRLFFQCSPFDELLVNIVSSFVCKNLLLLHIICGYQCDKAMTKNGTREVIWYHFTAVKWYHITSRFELSNQIDCNNLVGPIRLHVIF